MNDIKLKARNKITGELYSVDTIDFTGNTIRKGDPCFVTDKEEGCFLLEYFIIEIVNDNPESLV